MKAMQNEDAESEMSVAAQESVKLSEAAKECALKKKSAGAMPKIDLNSLPEELASYHAVAHFRFNDISISSADGPVAFAGRTTE